MVGQLREERIMKRALFTAVCVLLAPVMALAAGFTANLSGDAGSGLAVITVSGDTISYNLLVSGISGPNAASLDNGSMTVDLAPTFTGGSAIGSVTNGAAATSITADPTAWTVAVSNGTDTISGALTGGAGSEGGTVLYHPVVANVPGLGGTSFVTDVRILNRSGDTATVTIDYYAEGAGGHSSPTDSATITVADDEQVVANDVVQSVFGATNTKGGVVITSDRQISAAARIYNDQRTAGDGTFGQYQPGLELSHGWAAGSVMFLSNDDPATGEGFRSNLGWFNPNPSAISVTFDAYDTNGFLIAQTTMTVSPYEQRQMNIGTLFPALATYGDCYISYSTGGGGHVFVYGSVVDNVNGDAVYVAATP